MQIGREIVLQEGFAQDFMGTLGKYLTVRLGQAGGGAQTSLPQVGVP